MALIFFSYANAARNNGSSEDSSKHYDGIVAIINGKIITSCDLEERIRLVLFSIGGDTAPPEVKARIKQEVLKEMIQERLKEQSAEKYAPKGGWVTDEEIKAAVTDIARRNHLDYVAFCKLLKSKGINKDILWQQIRVNLSWMAYVHARFGRYINISESEITRTKQEIRAKQSKESYYVRRMFFPVSNPKNEEAVQAHVNNIKRMLANGMDFSNLAKQFSSSADARQGGELGWVFPGQLSQEEDAALGKMPIGGHALVRNSRGYVILLLHNKKSAGLQSFTTMRLAQVLIPVKDPNPSKEVVMQIESYLNSLKEKSANARKFLEEAKASGICVISDPTDITSDDILPSFRPLLTSLQSGGVSRPLWTPDGVVVVCMLDRRDETVKEPTREEIREHKRSERLYLHSEHEIQEQMRRADIREIKEFDDVR